jgi:hypothetical protein
LLQIEAMKDEFIGFYDPTDQEINGAWDQGIFIFDANVLLNLYRYTEPTRTDFLLVFERIKDRLFCPYQVALEFQSNRHQVISKVLKSYDNILNIINDIFEKTLEPQLGQFRTHPTIRLEKIKELQKKFVEAVSLELDDLKQRHPKFGSNDEVLNKLTNIYNNKIGTDFSEDELNKLYSEGRIRYEKGIPPGFKDMDTKKKQEDRRIYGDLIVWRQVMAYSKNERKPVIFVTDDRKEDWWTIENGQTIRPRPELIKEFYDATKIRILIYNADTFLKYAKERRLAETIKEDTITEIKEVRTTDEKDLNFYKTFLEKFKVNIRPQKTHFQGSELIDYLYNETKIPVYNPSIYRDYFTEYLKTLYDNESGEESNKEDNIEKKDGD